jgi:hypothetical protein
MVLWGRLSPSRRLLVSKPLRWGSNLGLVVLNTVLLRAVFPLAAVGFAAIVAEQGWGLFNVLALPGWLVILLSVMALDLVIYWQHVMVIHHQATPPESSFLGAWIPFPLAQLVEEFSGSLKLKIPATRPPHSPKLQRWDAACPHRKGSNGGPRHPVDLKTDKGRGIDSDGAGGHLSNRQQRCHLVKGEPLLIHHNLMLNQGNGDQTTAIGSQANQQEASE